MLEETDRHNLLSKSGLGWCEMLKRFFWAITITFPLYLFVTVDQSPPSTNEIVQWTEQPKQIINYLKRNLAQFHQEIQRQQDASIKSEHSP